MRINIVINCHRPLSFCQIQDNHLWQTAEKWNPEGVYSVAGHGNPEDIHDQPNGKDLSPEELAERIMQDKNWKGQDIYLNSCSTGKGANSFAQQLADILGVNVIAPTDDVTSHMTYTRDNNQVVNFSESVDNNGKFKPFQPTSTVNVMNVVHAISWLY